jgi:sec-independent protein translocase protein TatB
MIDFGFDKLALISAVALVVIGPEKLPRVARTVGTLLGRAQRYVADVKAEVNRSIELEDLKKMKTSSRRRGVEQSVSSELNQTTSDLQAAGASPRNLRRYCASTTATPPPQYRHRRRTGA